MFVNLTKVVDNIIFPFPILGANRNPQGCRSGAECSCSSFSRLLIMAFLLMLFTVSKKKRYWETIKDDIMGFVTQFF